MADLIKLVLELVRELLGVGARRGLLGGSGRPTRPVTPAFLEMPGIHLSLSFLLNRARSIRRALLGLAAVALFFGIAVPILILGSLSWSAVAYAVSGIPVGLVMLGRGLNIDVARSRRDALSRSAQQGELRLIAAPDDLIADWQVLIERLRFTLDWLHYDPVSGELTLLARRVRIVSGWPQHIIVRGELTREVPSTFTVLVDSPIPVRYNFDANLTTLERIVRHFSRAHEPVR